MQHVENIQQEIKSQIKALKDLMDTVQLNDTDLTEAHKATAYHRGIRRCREALEELVG